jgi:hypothetical protein
MSGEIEIKRLEGTEAVIDDGTPIVRYMKLETFLLFFAGQVFIPSRELLTSLDPLESKLVFELPGQWRFWEDHANEILNRFRLPELAQLARRRQGGGGFGLLTVRGADGTDISAPGNAKGVFRICLSELSRERCVWC